jgi:hypothetical protein
VKGEVERILNQGRLEVISWVLTQTSAGLAWSLIVIGKKDNKITWSHGRMIRTSPFLPLAVQSDILHFIPVCHNDSRDIKNQKYTT